MNKKFNYPVKDRVRIVQNPTSLRGRLVNLLQNGATFDQVVATVQDFDVARGVESKNVERRAYEAVRLLHSYVGYGLITNDEGVIQLVGKNV